MLFKEKNKGIILFVYIDGNMERVDYPKDCLRIQRVCLEKGYYGGISECEDIWQEYSTELCAGWLFLPDTDEELWLQIEKYVIARRIE
jgi:hypothetical protein